MFFNESRWDAMNEHIKKSNAETQRYVDKRIEILTESLHGSRDEMYKHIDDLIKIQQIVIDHLHERIAHLEKEVDELRKKVES